MKKKKLIVVLFVAFFVTNLYFVNFVHAQALPIGDVNTTDNQPILPTGEDQSQDGDATKTEDKTTTDTTSTKTNESFINGVMVGAIVGLIVGGVFAWLLKDKIY